MLLTFHGSTTRGTWLALFDELKTMHENLSDDMSTRIDEIKSEIGESAALTDALGRVFDLKKVRAEARLGTF